MYYSKKLHQVQDLLAAEDRAAAGRWERERRERLDRQVICANYGAFRQKLIGMIPHIASEVQNGNHLKITNEEFADWLLNSCFHSGDNRIHLHDLQQR